MNLASELRERGFVKHHTGDSLETIFSTPKTVYLGIDPTADSLHVGHLVPYLLLEHIRRAGHRVIIVLGGGTALIGDPSFKEQERDIADAATIKAQADGLTQNIRALTKDADILFVNNHDWLGKLSAIEFLRDVGKHFTVNAMVKKESVARRFESEQGISFTEFSYSLLQAYDYYHLHMTEGCDVQIGGSDQWGNVIAGVDLIRRKTGHEVHAFTMSLIVDAATGKKFGKSEGNAVWLDPKKTSPYAFYQFWLNTSDEIVGQYLKLFTFLPVPEINDLLKEAALDPGKRVGQRRLASEVTRYVHGEEVAQSVVRISDVLFGEAPLSSLAPDELTVLTANAPMITATPTTLLVDTLVESGLSTSKREARMFMESGAVQVDGQKVTDVAATFGTPGTLPYRLLKRGKKQVVVVQIV